MSRTTGSRLFPALLRYWRTRRGFSQLELAIAADVSTRHISFLESARAGPSEEMLLRLLAVMNVPLSDQNQALVAAGFAPRFASPAADSLPPEVEQALEQMMSQHEPFPLVALSLDGTIVRKNAGAQRLFQAFVSSPAPLPERIDMFSLLCDPRFMRPYVVDWPMLARALVSRLHREHLQRADPRLAATLERLFELPGMPREWRQPDFSSDVPPTLRLCLARNQLRVGFLVAVTTFSAPQRTSLDELRIESCFPLDDATRQHCRGLGP